jgi:serine/threonine protein kinase
LYDLVSQNGDEYLIEEYVDGGTLRDLLRKEGRLSPERVVKLGEELCQAISAIWAVRIVHRDIKPGNVLLKSNGHAKLADFGVAQLEEMSIRTDSMPSPHPGTLAYKSPEQEKTYGYLDVKSDLYSLGLVLYEALTGKLYKSEHVPVSALVPDVPRKLDLAIMRALEEKPSDRYQDAEEFEMALHGSLDGSGRKWPVWFIGSAVVLILLGIVIRVAPSLAPAGTLTPTMTLTVTASPPATPTATAAPTRTLTQTSTPTPTAPPSPTPTATRPTPTPVPAVSAPRLTSPSAGSTVNGTQLSLQWAGSLPNTQYGYRVKLRHADGTPLESPLLAANEWSVSLPARLAGGWDWFVEVVRRDNPSQVLAQSASSVFYNQPYYSPLATPSR